MRAATPEVKVIGVICILVFDVTIAHLFINEEDRVTECVNLGLLHFHSFDFINVYTFSFNA